MKKGLLILFGQWRNFESISQQMKDEFSKFDIVVSTWDRDYGFQDITKEVTEERVRKVLPDAKAVIIHNELEFDDKHRYFGFNTGKMLVHWQRVLPYIDTSYEVVVLQRFDVLCNTSTILNENIQEGKMYIDWGPWGDNDEQRDVPWAMDWIYVGTPTSMIKWINLFPTLDEFFPELKSFEEKVGPTAHLIIGKYMELYGLDDVLVLSNEFKKLWYKLFKRVPDENGNLPPDIFKSYNDMGIRFFNLDINSKQFKLFYDDIMAHNGPWKDTGNKIYLDIDWS